MQVYGLITDGTRFLVPKKAERNNLWDGVIKVNQSVVNQAGQYACFGGRRDNGLGESTKQGIMREILEESGADILNNFAYNYDEVRPINGQYEYGIITVSVQDFNTLNTQMTNNITLRNVRDGEMQSVNVINQNQLDQSLGVRIPTKLFMAPPVRNSIRQSIDWYADIAQNVQQMNIQPLQVVQPVNNQGWVTCKNVGILALGVGGLALTYAATAYFGLNLRRSEKESLIETTGIEDYNLKNELLKANSVKQDIIKKLQTSTEEELPSVNGKGNITFIPEENHITEHGNNTEKLIAQIKSRSREENEREVIFLERKEEGNNFGMNDVRLLANIIKHNETNSEKIVIPKELKTSPIYQDAQLYNIAIENGVKVIGAEGKGLKHSKESPQYNQEREEYMAGKIQEMLDKGYNITMPVGANHIKSLEQAFSDIGNKKEINGSSKKQDIVGKFTAKVTNEGKRESGVIR